MLKSTAAAAAGTVAASHLASAAPAQTAPAETTAEIMLSVNGRRHRLAVEPRVTLLDALRERLGLTGTKKGCDRGETG